VDPITLTAALVQEAHRLGFDLAAAVPPSPAADGNRAFPLPEDISRLENWLASGDAAEMRFFHNRFDAYRDPNRILEGVSGVLMLATNYRTVEPAAAGAGQGRVARYAWGGDYHDLVHDRLKKLAAIYEKLVPGGRARGIVDTAPFLERAFAARAGLGWIGKNTTLINRTYGSWLFLAALLTTEELSSSPEGTLVVSQGRKTLERGSHHQQSPEGATVESRSAKKEDRAFLLERPEGDSVQNATVPFFENAAFDPPNPCANCRACLDACPTGALIAPYTLDARRCISYLTIEHRGDIPDDLKPKIGDRLFGCDACQEACPWNRATPSTTEPTFHPREGMNPVDLADLRNLDDSTFRRRFRGTPLHRTGLDRLLRNAAIVHRTALE
jgi:epoxyqueuosine reductase